MKKLTLIPAAMLLCAGAYGQGAVGFENGSGSKIEVNGTAVTSATQPTVQIALYYQPDPGGAAPAPITSTGVLGSWELFGTTPLSGPPGFFNGGSSVVLNGVAAGGNAWLEVVAWNNSSGNLATALANNSGTEVFGNSSVFSLATVDPTVTPKPPANLLSSNPAFTGVDATPLTVPEPTTLALGALGAASLLAFRRKK